MIVFDENVGTSVAWYKNPCAEKSVNGDIEFLLMQLLTAGTFYIYLSCVMLHILCWNDRHGTRHFHSFYCDKSPNP